MKNERGFQPPTDEEREDDNPHFREHREHMEENPKVTRGKFGVRKLAADTEQSPTDPKPATREYLHEDHHLFSTFYRTMDFDAKTSFMTMTPEKKEQLFTQWLEDRKK